MRVLPNDQGNKIGSLLMSLVALEIRTIAKQIHFTIPEQIWNEKNNFFENYGFINKGLANVQYRLFNDAELACSADFKNVLKTMIKKLPSVIENFTLPHCDLVLSVKPTHAEKIIAGKKSVEMRRVFSEKWKGSNILIYASAPLHQFVGEAVISHIFRGTPMEIWKNWEREIGCTIEEFKTYCEGTSEIMGFILTDVKPYKHPIYKTQLEYLIQQEIKVPQSYCEVNRNTLWPTALSFSCLLQSAP